MTKPYNISDLIKWHHERANAAQARADNVTNSSDTRQANLETSQRHRDTARILFEVRHLYHQIIDMWSTL
jgi:hypothetical protein